MSYDLASWNDTRIDRPEPKAIYAELVGGRAVEGLDCFDAAAMLEALAQEFAGVKPSPVGAASTTAWEAPDGSSVFEFTWSPQHLVATARSSFTGDQMNAIIDAGVDVGGGRLYDSQTDERFDG